MWKQKTITPSPQPPQHRAVTTHPDTKDSSISSALMLSGIALFSLALVAGVTVWKHDAGSETSAQFAAAPTPGPSTPRMGTPIADTVSVPVARPSDTSEEQRTIAALITPKPEQKTRPVAAPRLPQVNQASAAPQVAETIAAKPQKSPLLAIVDESNGTVHELGVEDLRKLSYSDQEMATTAIVDQDERVTRLDDTGIGAKRITAPVASRTPTTYTCVDAMRAIAAKSTVFFYTSGAELTPRAVAKIRNLGAALDRCPQAVVQVNGHSDSSGDEALNMAISWQRADNTIAALASLGFDTSRLDPVGFGSSLPLAEGDSGSEIDRRVEFQVMEKR